MGNELPPDTRIAATILVNLVQFSQFSHIYWLFNVTNISGDSGVGKTCLLFRFSDDAFNTSFIATIGKKFVF
jgi:hypothetical protein